MPIWYIERIPAAGGATDTRTLADWGIDSAAITEQAWGLGSAQVAMPSDTSGTTAPAWAHMDHLVLWAGNPAAGGTRRAHLWVLMPGHAIGVEAEAHAMQLVGPWWWLEQTQYFYPLHVVDITTDPETGAATGCTWEMRHGTEVVWTSWAAQSTGTILGQIHRALWCAVDNDAPIAIGAIDLPGLAPVSEEQTATCADIIARAARFSPRASQWWDMSGEVPTFRAAALASRPVATLAIGGDTQTADIAPRHDLRIDVVRVGYTYIATDGFESAAYDIAGNDALKDGPHTLRALVPCPDPLTATNAAAHYLIAAQLYDALHSTPYSGGATWWGDAAGVLAVHPGHALHLTGGMAAWGTMAAPIASTTLTITSAAEDSLSIALGLPATLGANDLFELYNLAINLGSGAVSTGGGTSDPAPSTPGPGPVNGLNGPMAEYIPSVSLQVQQRGGGCEIKGWREYDGHESSPPRRYRQMTASGVVQSFNGASCANLQQRDEYSGASVMSPTTAVCTASAIKTKTYPDILVTQLSTVGSAVDLPNLYGDPSGPNWVTTKSATSCRRDYDAVCRWDIYVDPWSVSGMERYDLSDEDTEDSAIARMLLTGPGGTELEWATGEALSVYTERTTFTFYCLEFRFRATVGTTPVDKPKRAKPWAPYILRAQLQDRPAGTTVPWEDSAVVDVPFSASLDGTATIDWQPPIRAPRGTERRLAYVTIIPG